LKKNLKEKVKAVENSLLPAISLQGSPAAPGNLMQRMEHYQAPGVSIAVINDQAIEWARGYGVLQAGSAAPVTPQTLFQAASISKPVAAMAALHLAQTGQLDLDADVNGALRLARRARGCPSGCRPSAPTWRIARRFVSRRSLRRNAGVFVARRAMMELERLNRKRAGGGYVVAGGALEEVTRVQ